MKFNKFLKEATTTSDIAINTAKKYINTKDKKCKEGYIWCPEKKKCVKKGSGDGNGIRSFLFGRNK